MVKEELNFCQVVCKTYSTYCPVSILSLIIFIQQIWILYKQWMKHICGNFLIYWDFIQHILIFGSCKHLVTTKISSVSSVFRNRVLHCAFFKYLSFISKSKNGTFLSTYYMVLVWYDRFKINHV